MPKGIVLASDYFAHAGVKAAVFSGELAANRLLDTRAYVRLAAFQKESPDNDKKSGIGTIWP
jgi:hypothetical protein